MQAPRLVATDVDGTLLDPELRVTPRTAVAVRDYVAGGGEFVLVTGRPPRWIPPVAAQLTAVRLAVCANGAVLYDVVADRVLDAHEIDPATLGFLAEAVAETLPGAGIAVERVGVGGHGDEAGAFLAEADYRHAWKGDDSDRIPRAELLSRPAVKLLVRAHGMTSEQMVAALTPVVGDAVDLTFSHAGGLVEASSPGITKATGLAEVAGSAGIEAAGIVAFGDMPNDIEMLRWAGHGVAMANAHPDLLAVADEVTAANTDDGVAQVLERWAPSGDTDLPDKAG
ncbi:HAD family hydrolase [Pseudonocardia benzenivorans]|uniref:HAD family hydrolase n=1 Tax=Pseudonocardia benzenivorans TaxID=228005 RepID=A0ABW3V941_9PSEU